MKKKHEAVLRLASRILAAAFVFLAVIIYVFDVNNALMLGSFRIVVILFSVTVTWLIFLAR